jgi:Ca2+/Na+ antiporter
MNPFIKASKSISILHIVILVAITISQQFKNSLGLDTGVLLGANLFFYILTLISMAMQKKYLHDKNPNVYVRAVIGSMMIRMFATIIAVLIYVKAVNNKYDAVSLFLGLSLYLVYLSFEVKIMMKLNQKNA